LTNQALSGKATRCFVRLESLTYFDTEAIQKEVKNREKRVSRKDAATQRKEEQIL